MHPKVKVTLDISPIANPQHAVRGVGEYIHNLVSELKSSRDIELVESKTSNSAEPNSILHIPYFDPFQLTLPKIKKQPLIVTIHDLIPLLFPGHFPAGVKGKFKWAIQKRLLKNVDAIITDSESAKKDIINLANIPKSKIHVIHLAASSSFRKITDTNLSQKVKKKYSLPEKFALYVGDVTWNKNVPNLISAATNIKAPLVLVGKTLTSDSVDNNNPWNKDLVKAKKQLSENKYCNAIGYVTREELLTLYNLATCLVFPSRYEGFGLPVLEAMACGCPVITTTNGSLKEVANDAALFTDTSIEGIEKSLHKLLSDADLQKKLSQAGLKNAEKFTWNTTADKTIHVYERVSSDKR